jgi:hypothetical protein
LEIEEGQHDRNNTLRDGVVQERHSLAFYDRYRELVNTWVVVTGKHAEKGVLGRIRDHLGQQILRLEARSGSRLMDVHVDFLANA